VTKRETTTRRGGEKGKSGWGRKDSQKRKNQNPTNPKPNTPPPKPPTTNKTHNQKNHPPQIGIRTIYGEDEA